MNTAKSFSKTRQDETVLPVIYIEKYTDVGVKHLFQKYKFNTNKNQDYFEAKTYLQKLICDIIVNIKTSGVFSNNFFTNFPDATNNTVFFFTSPPSTMHARREKSEDSMRELFRQDEDLYSHIFTVRLNHIKNSKAQHIGSNRKKRIAGIKSRYNISVKFQIQFWHAYVYKKMRNFNFSIIDDVVSTGGTLLACTETLNTYMNKIQKKKPDIRWNIQVFSISH